MTFRRVEYQNRGIEGAVRFLFKPADFMVNVFLFIIEFLVNLLYALKD